MKIKIIELKLTEDSIPFTKELQPGITVFQGANRSGKSILFRVFAGLQRPYSGKIVYPYGTRKGAVFENPDDSLFFPRVIDEIAWGVKDKARVEEALKLLEVPANVEPMRLSYSERKLLSIATLTFGPQVGLIDEPLRGLVGETKRRALQLIQWLHGFIPFIIVFATPDDELARISDEVIERWR